MKVKNLAFFGAMATILSVGGAYADGPATLIASKNYVDTQGALKEDKSNKTTEGLITADNNGAITEVANGTDTAYASTSAISSDLKKVKAAITAAQTAATYDDTALAGRVQTLENAGYITKSVNDLENYTTTTDMNTALGNKEDKSNKKTAGLITADSTTKAITAVAAGSATDYASTSAISSDLTKVKEAIDKKANSTDIVAQVNADWNATSGKGEILNKPTTISGYGITDAYTKTEVDTSLSGKQPTIDSTHKVSADNIDDTNTTNKFVTDTEKSTWSGKQDAITDQNKLAASKVSGLATVATSGAYSDLSGTPNLATVATSGDYDDLTNKPTIPTVEQTYSASSANAQSGVAVAEALGTLDGGTITSTAGQPFTSISQANGQVSASTGTIKYAAAMDSALPNVDTPDSTTAQNCTENTCILTYKNGKYTWTPMQL